MKGINKYINIEFKSKIEEGMEDQVKILSLCLHRTFAYVESYECVE